VNRVATYEHIKVGIINSLENLGCSACGVKYGVSNHWTGIWTGMVEWIME